MEKGEGGRGGDGEEKEGKGREGINLPNGRLKTLAAPYRKYFTLPVQSV